MAETVHMPKHAFLFLLSPFRKAAFLLTQVGEAESHGQPKRS